MISYTLNIAGYNILFQAKDDRLDLNPAPAQKSFISDSKGFDLAVNVMKGPVKILPGSEKVFKSPYIEEINGIPVKRSNKFWTVYKHGDYILVHTTMPLSETIHEAMIVIRPGEKAWDILFDTDDSVINPITYPLDGLLFYYLTAIKGDIFIHGSGVELNNKGYLFTGMSGKGKTTIARLFNEDGARVIHDDRLIIRKIDDRYVMYNTPVYENEQSSSSFLDRIYTISHGSKNGLTELGSVESLTSVMANCIQHHWNSSLIGILTKAIMDMTEEIGVKGLEFLPESSVVNFISNDS